MNNATTQYRRPQAAQRDVKAASRVVASKDPPRNKSARADFVSYAARYAVNVQKILRRVRRTIKQAAPAAAEVIKYNMPAFTLHDQVIIYLAAFKTHIGLYPPVRSPAELRRAAAPYAGAKGNLQFPYAQPIPYDLIVRIVRSRVAKAAVPAQRDS